jgi:hypothetical protein
MSAVLDTSFAPGAALTSCDGSPSNVVVSARTVGDPTKKKMSQKPKYIEHELPHFPPNPTLNPQNPPKP